jgi:hypothetical protein
MNPYEIDNTISGLNTIWADSINGVPGDYFTDITSNVQAQIDRIIYNPTIRGPQGPQGVQGPIGPVGPMGPMGYTGSIGPQGTQGPIGPIGPQGPMGYTGAIGPAGSIGSVGPQGPMGYTGYTGPTGSIGPIGYTGPAADLTNLNNAISDCNSATNSCLAGITGVIASTVTFNAVLGAVNTALSLCTPGPPGAAGAGGAKGDTGPAGPRGDRGDRGDKGDQGDAYFTQNGQTISYSGTVSVNSPIFQDQTTQISGGSIVCGSTTSNYKTQVSNSSLSINYTNPLTNQQTSLSSIATDSVNNRAYFAFKSSYSNAPLYDSRIYDDSYGSNTNQNGQGKVNIDAKVVNLNAPTQVNSLKVFTNTQSLGYIGFKGPTSNAPNYDSRIYENSGTSQNADGKGTLTVDALNVNFSNSNIQSKFYNDYVYHLPPSYDLPVTMIGNGTESICISYQNTYPVQAGMINITSSSSISINAPRIYLNGTVLVNGQSGSGKFIDIPTYVNQVWNNTF